ncbi:MULTISPECIES: helix-turn-helix domain-containing protein [Aliivibrio]|uniref:helix-turn-helix domain-containing protein n=1 Tax=Aliivibrio TaxID=511678 RepID=UPI0006CFC562|nr:MULTISPECIES: helix-turn-helix domain-containing protein [Aliivibrio]MBD1569751.1 helix-turn-helix domain-containing protein [Aliivibrio sp. S10_S31]USR97988.1 helix-turn-helix domain-containing protein [Aliivibrio fischeri ATCC 7744 = JCM 18803 = DSM 507]GGK43607.1 hypothetical protein GCM10007987_28630 [Aliivibrio fischeri]
MSEHLTLSCKLCCDKKTNDQKGVKHEVKDNYPVNEPICRFLSLMTSKPIGYIHKYDDIYDTVWPDSVVSSNSLLLLIHNARKVLPNELKIYNVRGKGYFLSKN